jgi:hypothetical protein
MSEWKCVFIQIEQVTRQAKVSHCLPLPVIIRKTKPGNEPLSFKIGLALAPDECSSAP